MRARLAGRRLWTVAAAAFLLFAFVPGAPPTGALAIEECTDPPAVFPVADLEAGMTGTGWTVVQGTEPESFDVEILGIYPDGIAPDIDLIVGKASGGAIDVSRGIARGYSGSPVYIDGKLVGSVSYGFWGEPYLAGITPAQPMVDVLQYPTSYGRDSARALRNAPTKIRLTDRFRAKLADQLGVRTAAVPSIVSQLEIPVGVSGLTDEAFARAQKRVEREGLPWYLYQGSSAPAPTSIASEPLAPGDVLGVVNSYGDLTYAGYGTVTAVCGDMVIGWGHWWYHEGQVRDYGMQGGSVLLSTRRYKLAIPGELHGVIDQDRWVGVRGIEGVMPRVMPILTDMTNTDTGKRLPMETFVVSKGSWPRWVTWDHFYVGIHQALDAHQGSVDMTWTIEGTYDGEPFTLTRSDVFAGWVIWSASYAPYLNMRIIQYSDFKPIKFTKVTGEATLTEDVTKLLQRRPFTASSLQPTMEKRRRLDVKPGDTIRVMAPLAMNDGSGIVRVEFELAVPADARGDGWIRIEDGNQPYRVPANTFAQLINRLQRAEHNTDLVVRFKLDSMDKAVKVIFPQAYYVGGDDHQVRVEVIR